MIKEVVNEGKEVKGTKERKGKLGLEGVYLFAQKHTCQLPLAILSAVMNLHSVIFSMYKTACRALALLVFWL